MKKVKKMNNGEMQLICGLDSSKIYLYGDICSDEWDKWSNDNTAPSDIVDFFADIPDNQNVDIYINSGGGSVYGGLAIYNTLKRHTGFKTVHIDGIAASIASVIACAGDKVIAPKNSTFMIHKPSLICHSMNADEMRAEAERLDETQEILADIYMTKVKDGIEKDTIQELINAETWLIGDKIRDYFNFDISNETQQTACISNYYRQYAHVPENLLSKKNNEKETEKLKLQLELLSM